MLSKAVLSFVGVIGIAAVLASPLAAQAAETSDAPSGKPTVARQSPSHGHRHKSADRKARKRGTRHIDLENGTGDPGTASGTASKQGAVEKEKRASAHCDDSEVSTERASAKTPPKQSSTPLPTLAAVTTKQLEEPISIAARRVSTRGELAIEPRAHATEPRRTPIIRASSHTDIATEGLLPRHGADSSRHESREKRAKPPCLHAPVSVTRGTEEETFSLTRCDGSALPQAVEALSIMVRPGSAAKPASPIAEQSAKTGAKEKAAPLSSSDDGELVSGIKKIDERLVERLQLVLDHFAKPEATAKIFVVSGVRKASKGSFHAMGRAVDFRVEGVENTDLVAFCKTLPDTGCGFYPSSSFIHLDVRDSGSGHVSWIDASGPGEKPEYVAAWPVPPNDDDAVKQLAKLDDLQLLPPPDRKADPKADAADENSERSERTDPVDRADPCGRAERTAPLSHGASVTRKLEDE